ncbi:MAG: class I SAM-dependent methyltransferase [Acidobacteriota bacterium]
MADDAHRPTPALPPIEAFLDEPTRDLRHWRSLFESDTSFPIRSHRGIAGRILVTVKRLLRPLVKTPQNDLWERQRVFQMILLDHLITLEDRRQEDRIAHLEAFMEDGLKEVIRHDDALFSRVDQKLDRYRREAATLVESLGTALAASASTEGAGESSASSAAQDSGSETELARALDERAYLELERRYRGTEEEIAERLEIYVPYLEGSGPVLDLGCGRGELLALCDRHGVEAKGIDSSAAMVAHCRERGLKAEEGDLFQALAQQEPGSLGAVVSFHVVEHLPPASLDRLSKLAARALRPGGVLILETPNPLSVVVAARSFWLDPTHQRPVHPASLKLFMELAGFETVERLDLRPFGEAERLPEIDLAGLGEEQRELADGVNRLRDRLDELLFGYQDYALVGRRAG